MNRKSILAIIIFFFVVVVTVSDWNEALAKTYVIRHGHPSSNVGEEQTAALVFKDYVETKSNGRIKVEIYPAGQLGSFREMIESVILGTQQSAHTTVGGIANVIPEIQVCDIPYIFPDARIAEMVYDSWFTKKLREFILKKAPNLRLMGIGTAGGYRCFTNTKREVRTPDDLKGLKIRTINSEIQIEFVKTLGAIPTPVPWAEVYTALQTGVVDGSKNHITLIVDNKLNEVAKFHTKDNHTYTHGFLWMNNEFFQKLPDDLKRIVIDGYYHLKWMSRSFNKWKSDSASTEFRKGGGKIYTPTPAEKALFVEKAKPVRQWFAKKYGNEWLDLLDKAIAEAKAEYEKVVVSEMK